MNGTEAINRDFSSLKRGTRLADKILIADDEPSNRKILAQTYAARYTPLLQELRTDTCPFADLPEKRRTLYSLIRDEIQNRQWLKPHLLAQIEFAEWTPDGHLRHASLAGLRNDKEP